MVTMREAIAYGEILLEILAREEEHVDLLARQFDLIGQTGIEPCPTGASA
ncbi:MAG: hypothetical protein J2P47_06410 [Acetobacteraceae bacterium]|nr:hypothetical protein [Acetobacteraceae bacterium]